VTGWTLPLIGLYRSLALGALHDLCEPSRSRVVHYLLDGLVAQAADGPQGILGRLGDLIHGIVTGIDDHLGLQLVHTGHSHEVVDHEIAVPCVQILGGRGGGLGLGHYVLSCQKVSDVSSIALADAGYGG